MNRYWMLILSLFFEFACESDITYDEGDAPGNPVTTGGASSVKTSTIASGSPTVVNATGGAPTQVIVNGGSQNAVVYGCSPNSQLVCYVSGMQGYQTCLSNGTWGSCVVYTSPSSCTDCDGDGESASSDCNDQDAAIHHGAYDVCNDRIDQDCSGFDAACGNVVDLDGDGDPVSSDCNDRDLSIHHGAYDPCGDGVDQNCDGYDPDC